MYKGFKLAALAGALSMVMGGSAFADSTKLTFGYGTAGNVVQQGDICTDSSQSNISYSCVDVIADPGDGSITGFRQTQVTQSTEAPDGSVSKELYLMTIVDDQKGTDTFSDVSFIRMGDGTAGSNVDGILGMQSLKSQGGTFASDSTLRSGWGITDVGGSVASIDIKQSLFDEGSDNTTTADNFNSSFVFKSFSADANGTPDGFTMSIDQATGLGLDSDLQVFALREKQGSQLPTTPGAPIELAANIGVTNDPVSWTEGTGFAADSIKSIWMGQKVDLGSMGVDNFGYVSYEKVDNDGDVTDDSLKASQYSLSNDLDISDWDEATGEAAPAFAMPLPCLDDPSGFTCSPAP